MNIKLFTYLTLLISSQTCIAKNSISEVFTEIYTNKIWGVNKDGEGCSGPGSTIESTVEYRKLIESFLKEYAIETIVDLGCGDWEFSRVIDWETSSYLGIDVVPHIIERNQQLYSTPTIQFMLLDTSKTVLPSADLLICKDVLQHLPHEDILTLISQFKNFKYCLITNDVHPQSLSSNNPQIKRGDYRPLDLTQSPFSLQAEKVLLYKARVGLKQTLLIKN